MCRSDFVCVQVAHVYSFRSFTQVFCVYAFKISLYVCKIHLWTFRWIAKVEASENVTLICVYSVCVWDDFWDDVCCYFKDWETFGAVSMGNNIPLLSLFFHSLFCSPSLCRPALLSSFPWGTVANGIFFHCCAPANHLASSSCARKSAPPPVLPSLHPHSALNGCLWRMQNILIVNRGFVVVQGGESRTVVVNVFAGV